MTEFHMRTMARRHTCEEFFLRRYTTWYWLQYFMVMPESSVGKIRRASKCGWIKIFSDEYHDLKLTQNLHAGKLGYYSANGVLLMGGIASAMEHLAM